MPQKLKTTILTRSVTFSAISMAANFALPLAALPFLTRSLGTSQFGALAMAQAAAIVLCQLVDFGFVLVASRDVARIGGDRNELREMYSRVQNARAFLALVAAAVLTLLVASQALSVPGMVLALTAGPAVVGTLMQASWFFQGRSLFGWLALANFAGKSLYFMVAAFLVAKPEDASLAGAAFGASYLVSGAILQVVARRAGVVWSLRLSPTEVAQTLARSFKSFLSLALLSIHTQLFVLLVGAISGTAAAGVLAAADRIMRGVAALAVPFANALFPIFSRLYAEGSENASRLRSRTLLGLIGIAAIGTMAAYFGTPFLSQYLMPDASEALAFALRILTPLPVLIAVGVLSGGLTLVPAGHDSEYFLAILAAEILGVAAFFFLMFAFNSSVAGPGSILAAEIALASLMSAFAAAHIHRETLGVSGRSQKKWH